MQSLTRCIVILLLISALTVPVAAEENRYGYITVQGADITLANRNATVTLNYTIDEGVQFLVHLLGMSDLRTKVLDIVNFENAEIRDIDTDHAVISVPGAGLDYGDGTYWFPQHEFGAVIPLLTVNSPQDSRTFVNTSEFPRGMGYFRV
ncbi:MAG: hypothetical protein PWP08_1402 [Methanofollis sp.]|nr:hypothetical protein [Methanofollis sp.]